MSIIDQQPVSQSQRVPIFISVAPSEQLTEAVQQFGCPLLMVEDSGAALRQIMLMQATAVIVLVTENETADASASLIVDLRHRRPELPVIALTDEHDEDIERALRAAGASAYFAGLSDGIVAALALRVHSGCSPPQKQKTRSAVVRIRGRPRRRGAG